MNHAHHLSAIYGDHLGKIGEEVGLDLISDALPFGRLWYGDTNAVANAIGNAEHFSRLHDAVIRVYDEAGK